VAYALKQPDVAKRLADMSIEPAGSTPAELAAFMTRERELWGKVIRVTGTTAN
jgi:tripartite-type tricarboxylate transporter receptor subunit TctC